jgi:hypothetical protein
MKTWILGLIAGVMAITPSLAEPAKSDDAVLKNVILSASADSWNAFGGQSAVRKDDSVQAGLATRVTARKSANTWDIAATMTINKPIAKGDVILGVFWARVETPPAGSTTATVPVIIGMGKAPYTTVANEPAVLTGKWAMYYVSGVAEGDYPSGSLNLAVQLAGDVQVVDLGPAFVLDFGPNYDRTKLPHNKTVQAAAPVAPAAAAPAAPADPYVADLAKLRTKLPVKGTLISDPGTLYGYGAGLTTQPLTAPDVAGGKALRTVMAKAGGQSWDAGVSSAVTGAIKKGDVVFVAAYVRATEPAPGTQAGLIAELGVHMAQSPWTALATSSASVPKGPWKFVYASGVATADYPPGSVGFGLQLGSSQQTIDVGPVYVLNLGAGIDTAALPNNFGKP